MRLEVLGPHAMSMRSACVSCGFPIHEVGSGNFVHSGTGLFSCLTGAGTTFAESADSIEMLLQEAYEDGARDESQGHEQALEDARDEGADEARRELKRELQDKLATIQEAIEKARAHEFGALRADESAVYPRPVHDAIPTECLDAIEDVLDA